MADLHSSAREESKYIQSEKVDLITLDSVAETYLKNINNPFLKIDTQGFEWQVLNGASSTLPKLKGITCELSLVTLYEGQHLWKDIISRLELEGFTLWAIQRGFTDPRDGRTLQMDAIFFRI